MRVSCIGIGTGIIYQMARYTISLCLEEAMLGREWLSPLAYAISSVLLSELHLMWTRITISGPQLSLQHIWMRPSFKRWKHLVVPTFANSIARGLMHQVLRQFSTSHVGEQANIVAAKEVLAIVLMLGFHVLAVVPTSISLVLTEASVLPKTTKTVIPLPVKNREATVAELLGGKEAAPFIHSRFYISQILWLMELHFKKSFIQTVFELVMLSFLKLII